MSHIENREEMIQSLREELVGPSRNRDHYDVIDCSVPQHFEFKEQANRPYRQRGSREEILQRDTPTKRYGVGVLYPFPNATSIDSNEIDFTSNTEGVQELDGDIDIVGEDEESEYLETDVVRSDRSMCDSYLDDVTNDISMANRYKPSSIGISFLVSLEENAFLTVGVHGGRYRPLPIHVTNRQPQEADGEDVEPARPFQMTWWYRLPVSQTIEFDPFHFENGLPKKINAPENPAKTLKTNLDNFDLTVTLYVRPKGNKTYLVTACLVNRNTGSQNESSLFQTEMSVRVVGLGRILPYPSQTENNDEERQSMELLYRKNATYAIGHGCAANWKTDDGTEIINEVFTESLPVRSTPTMTPEVAFDGRSMSVPICKLTGLDPEIDIFDELELVTNSYAEWISQKANEILSFEERTRSTAKRHLEHCAAALERMQHGIQFLREDSNAFFAFQLANRAILLQQTREKNRREFRTFQDGIYTFAPRTAPSEEKYGNDSEKKWRAFQLAFMLLSLHSTAKGDSPERDIVELIWFPTGGGKTEAYLGLSAFSVFYQRLLDPNASGTHILMRYTLRLLTSQQFQRASRLICAMEYLRTTLLNQDGTKRLGNGRFSIGIWVGRETTPNRNRDAGRLLRKIWENRYATVGLGLERCPWCGAQMGKVCYRFGKNDPVYLTPGFEMQDDILKVSCPDADCFFHGTENSLPVHVVDETIYKERPTLVIGTVDKFAMIPWDPRCGTLFGIVEGVVSKPPNLIIQDELHLISGPLGTMVGLYETLIETLCTQNGVKPKIVSSTATIRNYREQINSLYARDDAQLFPPSGIDADDSFFAKTDCEDTWRKYIGVYAPGLGSFQTVQVRTLATLCQSAKTFEDRSVQPISRGQCDPWWTAVLFFNSLRELGTTLTLYQSDIRDYLRTIHFRYGITSDMKRWPSRVKELTGRIAGAKVAESIAELERGLRDGEPNAPIPVDVCLATSIIEVGIDIDRLSLMVVNGQPKTSAQYIQVTGRVGRDRQKPGLVVVLYSSTKPRDRSHFEKFRSYHDQLYAQVEPTSVTPFSKPVLARALHAVLVGYARLHGVRHPSPRPRAQLLNFVNILKQRVKLIDVSEEESLKREIARIGWLWDFRNNRHWGESYDRTFNLEDPNLMYPAGLYVPVGGQNLSWATPTSMRNVDAECREKISNDYLQEAIINGMLNDAFGDGW